MLKTLALAGAAALSLATFANAQSGAPAGGPDTSAAPAQMPPPGPPPSGVAAMAASPKDYLRAAAQSDGYEMQSSNLAMSKSKNPQVRQFASMMMRDHQQTTATLVGAAAKSGLPTPPAPPTLRQDQQKKIEQLQSAGPSFDSTYMQQQVTAHQEALALHSGYARGGTDPNLRMAAQSAVPIVQQHLQMAQQIASGLR